MLKALKIAILPAVKLLLNIEGVDEKNLVDFLPLQSMG